ncbi:MAG: lipoyl(octanoyl) transferase LipB [Candidatus Nanopelagicaceae bacterium]|nr:lipoyl(octanoyl) transferase LipB [Actinomycetota bacterium]NCV95603.1 lipoyl(octanoyl) transferase LipB [Actinomycetota bacterium]NCW47272.1 lipoyl(octanoyl) transferase LipB [Actinomycetota bacterium]NCW93653.1 lipoyl(octanoyl) transferase LipB [Actinomycetota bacterium]NCW96385.1 lipoyl(octanoyl) transferase LipB [Actinomycetota bacterium]
MSLTTSPVALKRLGLIDYEQAWELQREIHREVADGKRPNTLLLLEHPPIFTAGRRTLDSERPLDGSKVIDVDRGGKITFHGPGQIVGYPIIKLRDSFDVVGFVRELENSLIEVCREFGISAERYCERSGVWLRDEKGDRKIAAIGIRVARGVTMHGFALNVNPDLTFYEKIIPCGIPDAGVTSMANELNPAPSIEEVLPVLERHLYEALAKVSS